MLIIVLAEMGIVTDAQLKGFVAVVLVGVVWTVCGAAVCHWPCMGSGFHWVGCEQFID